MEQTQNMISDERLATMISEIESDISKWPDQFKSQAWEIFGDDLSALRELTALRASHKRLVEALQSCMNNLNMTRLIMPADARTQTAELLAEYRAALAEARKLEGK